jgi:hypothetical protein
MPDVDGSAILGEGTLHDFDCADNAGAETTGLSEDDLHILSSHAHGMPKLT